MARGWARLPFGRQEARARLTEPCSTGRPWNRAPATFLVIELHFIFAQPELVDLPYYHYLYRLSTTSPPRSLNPNFQKLNLRPGSFVIYCSESGDKIQLGLQMTTFYLDNVGAQPNQEETTEKDKDKDQSPKLESDFISPIKPVNVDQTWPESQNLLL